MPRPLIVRSTMRNVSSCCCGGGNSSYYSNHDKCGSGAAKCRHQLLTAA